MVRGFLVLIAGMIATAQTVLPPGQAESSCVAEQSVWKQGMEFRHALCVPGIDVVVSPQPIPGFAGASSPIGYIVSIHNYSTVRIETDPVQWRLLWMDKKGTPREGPSLNARQAGISAIGRPFGRSTLFADQSETGTVWFKNPKSKDAMIAVVFEPDHGAAVTVQVAVFTTPLPLLP
jgi:hypothetical protein